MKTLPSLKENVVRSLLYILLILVCNVRHSYAAFPVKSDTTTISNSFAAVKEKIQDTFETQKQDNGALGIAALSLSLLGALFIILAALAGASGLLAFGVVFSVMALIMGIVGSGNKRKAKIYARAALFISGIMILVVGGIAILASAL